MSSRNLLNLILLVVVVVLVTVVVFKPGKKTPPVVKLTSLSKSAISKIEITHIGAKKIVLDKKDGKWQMLEPYALPANGFKADSITELAEAPSTAQYPISTGQDLKPYGLDIPRLTVTFNDKQKLEFGGTESLKHQRYVRVGNTLHLIFDRFYYNLSSAAPEFVDHTLLPGSPVITKLVLPKLTLTQEGDKWQAQPPVKQLSNDQVNELLDNWTSAHATEMLTYKPENNSEKALVYIKGQDKPLVFEVLHEKDAVSLGRADLGIQYKFTTDIGHNLLTLPAKIKTDTPAAAGNKTAEKTKAK